jgi:hypothetical protein
MSEVCQIQMRLEVLRIKMEVAKATLPKECLDAVIARFQAEIDFLTHRAAAYVEN